jgi:hypothetical protein
MINNTYIYMKYIFSFCYYNLCTVLLITVAAQSKAWTIFSRSNTGMVDSNPIQGMDVFVRLFRVYVGSGLAAGWSPIQGVLLTVYWLRNWKIGQGQ